MTVKRLRRTGWALLGTVASNTKPDVEYEIKRSHDGTLGCACMSWAMRKHCAHLDAWAESDKVVRHIARTSEVVADAPIQHTTGGETFTVRRAIGLGAMPDLAPSPAPAPRDRDIDDVVRALLLYMPTAAARQLVGDLHRSRVAERDAGFKETMRRVGAALDARATDAGGHTYRSAGRGK